jgi:hypothetical protein
VFGFFTSTCSAAFSIDEVRVYDNLNPLMVFSALPHRFGIICQFQCQIEPMCSYSLSKKDRSTDGQMD